MGANLSESRALAATQAQLNRMNQVTPWGQMTYTGPRDDDGRLDPYNTTVTTTLSPEQQRLLQMQQGNQLQMGQRGAAMLNAMPGAGQPVIGGQPFQLDPFRAPNMPRDAQIGTNNRFNLLNMMGQNDLNFEQARGDVERATFDRAMSLMNPEFDRQEASMQQRLANQGLPQASRAHIAETTRFDDTRNRAVEQAAMAAVLAGGDEQSRLLADLLNTSAAGMGQAYTSRGMRFGEGLQGYNANTGAALSERGINANEAITNRQIPFNEMLSLFNLQPQPTAGNMFAPSDVPVQSMATPSQGSFFEQVVPALIGAAGTAAGGYMMSDRRLKTDVRRVGSTDDGLPISLFRYKGEPQTHMGVMAQDVARVKPEAVAVMPTGHLAVNYGRL